MVHYPCRNLRITLCSILCETAALVQPQNEVILLTLGILPLHRLRNGGRGNRPRPWRSNATWSSWRKRSANSSRGEAGHRSSPWCLCHVSWLRWSVVAISASDSKPQHICRAQLVASSNGRRCCVFGLYKRLNAHVFQCRACALRVPGQLPFLAEGRRVRSASFPLGSQRCHCLAMEQGNTCISSSVSTLCMVCTDHM